MILESYQDQQAMAHQDPPGQSFATVGTVYEDGIALIFNGAEKESLKHYKCNACARFESGQRVRIIGDSGTYVVEYPVGNPAQSIYADRAEAAAYANKAGYAQTANKAKSATVADTATSAGSADTAKSAGSAEVAKSARTSQISDKATNADNATNAQKANEADRALKVDNQASGKADLLFFYETKGTLYIRTTADSKWTKFTGTVVN